MPITNVNWNRVVVLPAKLQSDSATGISVIDQPDSARFECKIWQIRPLIHEYSWLYWSVFNLIFIYVQLPNVLWSVLGATLVHNSAYGWYYYHLLLTILCKRKTRMLCILAHIVCLILLKKSNSITWIVSRCRYRINYEISKVRWRIYTSMNSMTIDLDNRYGLLGAKP